jgi:predicted nucleic acid-binding protein
MKIFFDTNILLDVLLKRQGHYDASAVWWTRAESEQVTGCISAISFNNTYYIVKKIADVKTAQKVISTLRDSFTTVDCTAQIINQAIDARMKDFEDAIQYFSAIHAQCDYLLTRNVKHFPSEDIVVQTPEELLAVTGFEESL